MNFTYKTKMTATSEHPSFPIIGLEETDSTNRYLSDLCDNAPTAPIEYTTVTARFQTSGKGQRGNSWESEAGQNLLFSTVLYPRFVEARRQFVLSQIVSLAVKEELDTYTEGISIKWPNDIYWHEKKICGMLIENVLEGNRIGRCIPGIGINLNQTVFRSPAPNPVSLKQITGRDYDAPTVLDGFLCRLHTYYEALRRDADALPPPLPADTPTPSSAARVCTPTKMPTDASWPAWPTWSRTAASSCKTRRDACAATSSRRCNTSSDTGNVKKTVLRGLRAFGLAVDLCESLSERSDKLSNCTKVSPSVRTSRRTVRKPLRAFGQAVELCETHSKRSDKPSNCAKHSPSVRTSRRTVRNALRAIGQAVELCETLSKRSDKPSNCALTPLMAQTLQSRLQLPVQLTCLLS